MHNHIRNITKLAVCLCIIWFLSGCGKSSSSEARTNNAPSGQTVECPVCGLQFKQSESVGTARYKGKTYYFFLEDHQRTFKSNPEEYIETRDSAGKDRETE